MLIDEHIMGISSLHNFATAVRVATAILLVAITSTAVAADEPAAITTDITAEEVTAQKQQLANAESIAAEVKADATKYYDQALEQLRLAEERATKTAEWKNSIDSAPDEIQKLKSQLSKPAEPFKLDVPEDASLTSLEQQLANAQQKLTESENRLSVLQQEPSRRADRRTAVAQSVEAARDRLAKLEQAAKAAASPGTPPEVAQAQQMLNRASRQAIRNELQMLAAELPAYDATAELLDLETQAAQRTVEQRQQEVTAIRTLVDRERQKQAQQQELEARRAAIEAHPVLQPIAEHNLQLTQHRTGSDGLTNKIRSGTEELQQVKEQVAELESVESELTEKLDQPGMTEYAGPFLLQTRSDLPRTADLRRSIQRRSQLIAGTRFALADIRRRKNRLDDVSDEVSSLLVEVDDNIDPEQKTAIGDAAQELYTQQRTLLQDLESDTTAYFNLLNDLNAFENRLLNTSLRLESMVDDHLMWVRGCGPFRWENLKASGMALGWLFNTDNWRQVLRDSRSVSEHRPLPVIGWLVLFVILIVSRRASSQRLQELGRMASTSYLVPFRITVQAAGFTILLAIIWPTLVFGLGHCLYSDLEAADFSRGVGVGLITAAEVFLVLELTRRLLARGGLAEAHFRWNARRMRVLRRSLKLAAICLLPLIYVMAQITWDGNVQREDSLGRLLFMVAMVLVAAIAHHALRTLPPEVEDASPRRPTKTARLIQIAVVVVPLLVLLLSTIGFHFTARQLALRMFATGCLGLILLLLHGMTLRWLRLVRGTLALEQAKQRRVAREQAADSDGSAPDQLQTEVEPELDLQTINQQTRKLLQVCIILVAVLGLWWIWLEALPGHQLLEAPIWAVNTMATSSGAESTEGTSATIPAMARVVTRADFLLAVLVAVVAFVASRNIPGLVEVSIPPDVPLDAGTRYAMSTIVRYLLIALGVTTASSLMGIGWSKIQWLVAALSVGVGFGLQELVGNFISGLILLFERPVRVGDIVTVDGVTGLVTRVQIRATTIRNWDRQDYIVPNKDFITGRVLNWTLSSELNRIVINVGVSYNSDARHVRSVLFEILGAHPNVLEDPAALVTFEQFGDSVLLFVARAYLESLDNRLETINDLHTIIHERFNAEGIEIAFPQQDIHIRSIVEKEAKNQDS
jgi:potassium efflux system protein